MLSISYKYCKEADYQKNKDVLLNASKAVKNNSDLGFLNLTKQGELIAEITDFIDSVNDKFDTLLLIGIGGSALGNETIFQALGAKNNKNFYCIDNVDPDSINQSLKTIDCKKTLVNVISKSGGTPETIANFFIVYTYFKAQLNNDISDHFVFTTDPNKGFLNKVAKKYHIKRFYIPENVGGRFSILTPVGLLMMAFFKQNLSLFLKGADEFKKTIGNEKIEDNKALTLAYNLYSLNADLGLSNLVLMPYSSQLKELSNWFKQLWAESLGKKHDINGKVVNVGQTPISCVGATDQHSIVQLMMEGPKDKITVFVKVESFENDFVIENPFPEFHDMDIYTNKKMSELLNNELKATAFSLSKEGRPSIEISIPELNEYYLGQLIFFFEVLTAYSGEFYQINAFDQPGVEAGKIATKALLGQSDLSDLKNEILN